MGRYEYWVIFGLVAVAFAVSWNASASELCRQAGGVGLDQDKPLVAEYTAPPVRQSVNTYRAQPVSAGTLDNNASGTSQIEAPAIRPAPPAGTGAVVPAQAANTTTTSATGSGSCPGGWAPGPGGCGE